MDILQLLKEDYQRFPNDQTYSLYADDIAFKDPVFQFRGLWLYQRMIGFIQTTFLDCHMDLHAIQQNGSIIRTDWTLHWKSLLPWKPAISISGWSELTLNQAGKIAAHVDHWHCSRGDVLKQHFAFK